MKVIAGRIGGIATEALKKTENGCTCKHLWRCTGIKGTPRTIPLSFTEFLNTLEAPRLFCALCLHSRLV